MAQETSVRAAMEAFKLRWCSNTSRCSRNFSMLGVLMQDLLWQGNPWTQGDSFPYTSRYWHWPQLPISAVYRGQPTGWQCCSSHAWISTREANESGLVWCLDSWPPFGGYFCGMLRKKIQFLTTIYLKSCECGNYRTTSNHQSDPFMTSSAGRTVLDWACWAGLHRKGKGNWLRPFGHPEIGKIKLPGWRVYKEWCYKVKIIDYTLVRVTEMIYQFLL